MCSAFFREHHRSGELEERKVHFINFSAHGGAKKKGKEMKKVLVLLFLVCAGCSNTFIDLTPEQCDADAECNDVDACDGDTSEDCP